MLYNLRWHKGDMYVCLYLSRAHEILCRSHELLSRGHEMANFGPRYTMSWPRDSKVMATRQLSRGHEILFMGNVPSK
jgi:hypothetical protein